MPTGTRWLTTTRAVSVPLTLNTSTQSLSTSPACLASASEILAALLRLAALVPTGATLGLLHASAGAWALGFGLYLWRFWPWMIRPRADAAAKPAAPMMKIVPAGPRRAP
ncbi:NnrS family protein [Achromobacter ruhlandii]|uniref:NnrS family protein n=1 Tax=Achromobacter ruhlandii TaxID=72557 RepID=UPI003BA19F35